MEGQPTSGLSLVTKAIIGLGAGLVAGIAVSATGHPTVRAAGSSLELIGTLWINAILMTILPLVVSTLVVSVAGNGDPRALGRAGWRAGALILGLLVTTGALAAAVMPPIIRASRGRVSGSRPDFASVWPHGACVASIASSTGAVASP